LKGVPTPGRRLTPLLERVSRGLAAKFIRSPIRTRYPEAGRIRSSDIKVLKP
jgi:hypothetical protein